MKRRAFLALPALLPACTAASSGSGAFTFANGIGTRAGGPNLAMYAQADGGFARATPRSWTTPATVVDGLSRNDEFYPANPIPAATATPWRRATAEPVLGYEGAAVLGGGRYDIDGYMDRNPATGLLVAKGDTILVERYQYARTPAHRFASFSMAKTVTALLVGVAQAEGAIGSLDTPAAAHVPGLAGTEYGATPLRHLLTMSSGVQFREEYDGNDDNAILGRNTLARASAGGAVALAPFNTRIAAPGARFYYASSETYVLALVLRAAFGRPLAAVLAERVWGPMGAEAQASWLTDASGTELGYMGVNAVLRDYARLGLLMARGGATPAGRQAVPEAWITAMTRPHVAQAGRFYGYGYQTWIFPDRESFAFQGVRGQVIFVHPRSGLVMAHTAVRLASRDAGGADAVALWNGVRRAVG
ncbi:serine hydrolase domain-containing protein [Falsiroseomonas ponticola]|uniref:serine hydrolase domain-containing protein n=1 Tax=Falsiroseomonas ponticola TaxID=2786951 RepID=UPI001931C791|nr:serine hydrolase [Roseomonas ponticola]